MMVDAHQSRKVRHEFGWHLPPLIQYTDVGSKVLWYFGGTLLLHSCILFTTWTRKQPECPSRRRFKCRLWRKRGYHLLFLNSQLGFQKKRSSSFKRLERVQVDREIGAVALIIYRLRERRKVPILVSLFFARKKSTIHHAKIKH